MTYGTSKKKKKARVRDKKSHQGSFAASFCALLGNFSLRIFLLFLRPHGGNHGHWSTHRSFTSASKRPHRTGMRISQAQYQIPMQGTLISPLGQASAPESLSCILGTPSNCDKDCPWLSTVAMRKGWGHYQRRGAGQTTQGWIYTFGFESAWQATTGLSFPKESSDQVTLTQQLDLSCRVTSPVVMPQDSL